MRKREYDNTGNQNYLRFSNRNNEEFDLINEFEDSGDFESSGNVESNFDLHGETMNNRRSSMPRNSVRGISTSTCQELANIIGGEVITTTPACVVQRLRNINASILGRRTRSPLALPFALSFENNRGGRTLNLGETVILQKEINPFLTALRRRGLIVTAVHNHWLFDEPRLMYMHWENVGDPVEFARNSFNAAREAGLF